MHAMESMRISLVYVFIQLPSLYSLVISKWPSRSLILRLWSLAGCCNRAVTDWISKVLCPIWHASMAWAICMIWDDQEMDMESWRALTRINCQKETLITKMTNLVVWIHRGNIGIIPFSDPIPRRWGSVEFLEFWWTSHLLIHPICS